jgi:hypothetical protein
LLSFSFYTWTSKVQMQFQSWLRICCSNWLRLRCPSWLCICGSAGSACAILQENMAAPFPVPLIRNDRTTETNKGHQDRQKQIKKDIKKIRMKRQK